jgi:SAM-dependent methyltransferase
VKRLVKPIFFIAIPTIGEHSFLFTQSILGAVMPSNFSMQLRFLPGMEVGRARNLLIHEAKDMGAKYIMFRDEDTIAPANLVPMLLYHMETHPDWTFCSGCYSTKNYPPEPLIYTDWGIGAHWNWRKGDIIPVKFTGMGASIIRMSDIEDIECEEYEEKNPWTLAQVMVKKYFYTGEGFTQSDKGINKSSHTEDAHFFGKLEEKGLKSFVDTGLQCGHFDKTRNTIFFVPLDNNLAKPPDAWNNTPRVVNLGAGNQYSPYEIQVDLRGGDNIDYHCDITKLPLDWENTFDVAKASHVLEHFDYSKAKDILAEWYRILKPGGRLEIKVPDLQTVGSFLAEGNLDTLVNGNIYGDQGNEFWDDGIYGGYAGDRWLPHSTANNHHTSGYTAPYLLKLLAEVGFDQRKATRKLEILELDVEATKPLEEVKENTEFAKSFAEKPKRKRAVKSAGDQN